MGTQFFAAPVPAMRAIRRALKPGGRLAKVCWRRKADSPLWAETEQVVERFLSRPEEYVADTCGPGPYSLKGETRFAAPALLSLVVEPYCIEQDLTRRAT
jgi:hypothetical protein